MRQNVFQTIARRVGPALAVGTVLGLIGPFGTFAQLPILPRLGYWLAVVAVNWMLADAIIRAIGGVVSSTVPVRTVLVPLAGGLLAAFPATGVVAVAGQAVGFGWPENPALLFAQVLVLMAAIAVPVYAWFDMLEATRNPAPSGDADSGPALFLRRLPAPPEGPVLCLEMQDHYMMVHSAGRSDMILCRMEDAARELAALGRRVHRSWWVAEAALRGVERDGQRVFLCLHDGRRVPVGRSFRKELKAAGWL